MERNGLAPVWKALADPTRRTILDRLCDAPQTTGALTAEIPDLSRFAVMKHLGILVDAGLVLVRRRGRERWNYLNAVPLQQIAERWLRPYEAHWAAGLLRLKRHAEAANHGGVETMPEATQVADGLRTINIEQEVTIHAPVEKVFAALTGDISAWWGPPYCFSSEHATAFHMEPKVGGRFAELWGDGDEGGLWATVSEYKQNERLELTGRMAMRNALAGLVQFAFETNGRTTTVRMSHRALGEISEETRTGYTAGWQDLLGQRLKAWVEDGTRSGVGT